ncbi:MAG: hypothetical protein KDA85_22170, partial [Planctomycetaceae bacterium]|nr:hypothetical protein [Planctomycetaceae bacterium]
MAQLTPSVAASGNAAESANADLILRDCSLPGLARILNPESLRGALTGLSGDSLTGRVFVRYLRYKPGQRCVAQLQIGDDNSSNTYIATAMNAASWSSWSEKPPLSLQQSLSAAFDKDRLRLERFPCDRQLRHLPRLCQPEKRLRTLRRILPN